MAAQFGDYEILGELGFGGMARVHRARWVSRDRIVALKRLHSEMEPEIRKRFLREIEVVSALHHPHVVPVVDYGEVDGILYLAMELVEGPTVSRWLGERRKQNQGLSNLDEFHRIAHGLASALVHVHAAGVVHRDIKPANIFIDSKGEALLADFGLAQVSAASRLTPSGEILGTPGYLTPEQVSGGKVDARSDVYQVGLFFYELLASELPFNELTDGLSMAVARANRQIPLPSSANPMVPAALDRVVMRCLAVAPEDRYQSAAELERALADCRLGKMERPVPAAKRRETRAVRAESPAAAWRWLAVLAIVLLGLFAALGVARYRGASGEIDLPLTVDPTRTEAILSFVTDDPVRASARIEGDGRSWETPLEAVPTKHHSIPLAGLTPGTEYGASVRLEFESGRMASSRSKLFVTGK